MESLIKFTFICLLASIFSACNSSLTITKRQHSKGYYVATNKYKKNKTKISDDKIAETEVQELSLRRISSIEENLEESKTIVEFETNDFPKLNAVSEEINIKPTESRREPLSDAKSSLIPKIVAKTLKARFLKNNSNTKIRRSLVGDALRTIFGVILVIIITFILLLLASLGISGLINLFFFLLLILAFLWLFRVI